ncbi:hypothetical protein F7C95_04770 [Opitutia bacterium ISCC 51]|nr:hypothetical protein F7C95_04770 [Opitutae bacterium ISCC 51]QXD29288.1 hypothetical protein GA003_04750 [Opitutae bacterium ISCC 52]
MKYLSSFALFLSIPLLCLGHSEICSIYMEEMLDESTLDVKVIDDWHRVGGAVPTRQKYMSINVGELWPGQQYRVPVRLIVPADRKATGFHLTGGNNLKRIQQDTEIRGVAIELIRGGVGLVQTIVQNPNTWGQGPLGDEMKKRFIETLNTRYSIQFWGWPAGLCRAITAAYAETNYFEVGKIAVSGGSKNGASPSVSIIHDRRITAQHANVSPLWDSPLRMGDKEAWEALNIEDQEYAHRKGLDEDLVTKITRHFFRGGYFGPDYNPDAMNAGHSWEQLEELAERMADHVFISRNLDELRARGVDLYYHPGTHDYVCFDVAWGGIHHPDIPVYFAANTGHGKKKRHPKNARDESNQAAFLLSHFFDDVDELLESPRIQTRLEDGELSVTVTFPEGSVAESGEIWWMNNRGSDGSGAYLAELIPDENWRKMKESNTGSTWQVKVPVSADALHIDVFTNHRKTIRYNGRDYPTYISSPYTRVVFD